MPLNLFLALIFLPGRASDADSARPDSLINPADSASLQRGIDAAFRSGQKKIVVPPGVYAIAPSHYFRLTLDHPLAANFETLVDDPHANGSDYIVRNCTIKNHRARGMLLKADNGLVENNTVDGSTMAGIVLSPELWWNEAGFSRNIILRNNTVRHVGYQNAGPWMGQAGAITVRGDGDDPKLTLAGANDHLGHRNIVIENNTIEDCDGLQLFVSSADNVRIAGNRFINAQQHPSRRGADHIDPTALIEIGNCKDVTISDNLFRNRGPDGKEVIEVFNSDDVKQSHALREDASH